MKIYYDIALSERYELQYPPFSWLAKIEIMGENQTSVELLSQRISKALRGSYRGLKILGPVPCYLEKLRNHYRFQIVFKSNKDKDANGEKLHNFIHINFMDFQKKFHRQKHL